MPTDGRTSQSVSRVCRVPCGIGTTTRTILKTVPSHIHRPIAVAAEVAGDVAEAASAADAASGCTLLRFNDRLVQAGACVRACAV